MPPVPPKIIRALALCPDDEKLINRGQGIGDLACWNWALTGLNAGAVNITALYDYVNSDGNLLYPDGGPKMQDLRDLSLSKSHCKPSPAADHYSKSVGSAQAKSV